MQMVKKAILFGVGVVAMAFDEAAKKAEEVVEIVQKQGEHLNGNYKKLEAKIVSNPDISKS